jgi:hypothetical protein
MVKSARFNVEKQSMRMKIYVVPDAGTAKTN